MTDSSSANGEEDNVVELGRQTKANQFGDVAIDIEQGFSEVIKTALVSGGYARTQPVETRHTDLFPEDIQSVQSERHFRDRFGFALGKRGRMVVIKFMDDYDLTSWDVRALYRIGSMTWDGTTLRLRYVFWFKLLGVSQMLGLLIILLPALYVLFQNLDADLPARLFLVVFSSILIFGMAWAYRSFIAPFKALKRRGD